MLKDVVVVGATGRLGRAIMSRCDPLSSLGGIRRRDRAIKETPVGDEGFLDPIALVGKHTVINCAALATGNKADLVRVNATLAGKLARQAMQAGVRHFIHISSFRVYGRAKNIDQDTDVHPDSPYGQSKLMGEHYVRELRSDDFRVTCVRLPFLFGAKEETMLGKLVGLLTKAAVMPVPRESPARSMSTFTDVAYLVERIAKAELAGIIHLADPTPFTFELLAAAFRTEANRRLFLPQIPNFTANLLGRVAPKVKRSLFSSEKLSPDINFADGHNLPVGLENELRALVRHQYRKIE